MDFTQLHNQILSSDVTHKSHHVVSEATSSWPSDVHGSMASPSHSSSACSRVVCSNVSDMLNKSACVSSWWTNYWKRLITPASTLVTPFGAASFLKAMVTSRTHALDGGLRGETWQATDDSNIKFLSRRKIQ